MTLPNTNTPNGGNSNSSAGNSANCSSNGSGNSSGEDESDMFGPPRSSPPIGYHHHRSRVPMISPKLRQREERKRILQLCAHKLERIKDSEANLRRSVCINNTYCRLTDELRREKQMRYLQNLPKAEDNLESARENIFNHNIDDETDLSSNIVKNTTSPSRSICSIENQQNHHRNHPHSNAFEIHYNNTNNNNSNNNNSKNTKKGNAVANINGGCSTSSNPSGGTGFIGAAANAAAPARKRHLSSNNLVNDLEILDRELSAINAPMPLIDPEITQGAEQLEKAISLRKRARSSDDESDRLVREALSQFYIPPQRLISAIEDCPLDVELGNDNGSLCGCISSGSGSVISGSGSNTSKRLKSVSNSVGVGSHVDLDLDFDMNQNQKDFEVIMDALRLGTPSSTTGPTMSSSDSCGQAAMMSESANVFHNLVVTSLET